MGEFSVKHYFFAFLILGAISTVSIAVYINADYTKEIKEIEDAKVQKEKEERLKLEKYFDTKHTNNWSKGIN